MSDVRDTPQPLDPAPLLPEGPAEASEPVHLGTAGRQAVRNGIEFQEECRARLLRLGYQQHRTLPALPDQPLFIAQWRSPFRNQNGTRMTPDFYVWHPVKHPQGRLIELKSQEKPGSTDAKLHANVYALLATGIPAILVLVGGGFSRGWVAWCKSQETEALLVITSSDEWRARLNRGLF